MGKSTFIGGVRYSGPGHLSWGPNATWPLARLTLGEKGLALGLRDPLRRWFKRTMPDLDIPYAELEKVDRFGLSRGIRFRTRKGEDKAWDNRDGVVFWCAPGDGRRILAALAEHGVDTT
jgi:hypothetical protein